VLKIKVARTPRKPETMAAIEMVEGAVSEPDLQEEIDEELANVDLMMLIQMMQVPHTRGGVTLVDPERIQGTNATPERLILRALCVAGHHHKVIFVRHGTPWEGVAYYYTGVEDNNMGFGPVLTFPPSSFVSERVRGLIHLHQGV
jgi:hypothetical protein